MGEQATEHSMELKQSSNIEHDTAGETVQDSSSSPSRIPVMDHNKSDKPVDASVDSCTATEADTNSAETDNTVQNEEEEGELLEDGELDDEPTAEQGEEQAVEGLSIQSEENNEEEPSGAGKTQETEPEPTKESTESSESTEDESEKKKKRKKDKHKKEKRKRKREKDSKRSKKRRRHHYDEDDDETAYDNTPWGQQSSRNNQMMSPNRQSYGMSPPGQQNYGMSPPGRKGYDQSRGSYGMSPPPGPYDSPPYDSDEDDYSASLFSMLNDELNDPNVAASEKEAILAKQQKLGLSSNKMKKILKKKRWMEAQKQHQQSGGRRMERRERPKCKFYAEGKCQKGERCPFSHNFIPSKRMEACKFFLQGYCAKGDMCVYLHGEIPCKYYHTGQKCFSSDKCKYSHAPLSDSTRPLLERALMWDTEGVLKNRPSLLGTPPKAMMNDLERNREESMHNDRVENHEPSGPASVNSGIGVGNSSSMSGVNNSEIGGGSSSNTMAGGDSGVLASANGSVISVFDLNVRPSAELAGRLEAGLFGEFVDSDEDSEKLSSPRQKSPARSFYTDTLATPERENKPSDNNYDNKPSGVGANEPNAQRDLSTRFSRPADVYNMNQGPNTGMTPPISSGGTNMGNRPPTNPRPALLPDPNMGQNPPIRPNMMGGPPPAQGVNPQTAQSAVANLGKILTALRAGTGVPGMKGADSKMGNASGDPRAPADPRAQVDPRAPADPRAQMDSRAPADPRASVDPRNRADPRASTDPRQGPQPSPGLLGNAPNDPRMTNQISRVQDPRKTDAPLGIPRQRDDISVMRIPPKSPSLEINGMPTRPMSFKVMPITFIKKRTYVPPGAQSNSDMQKDPRIRKRLEALKSEGPEPLPSLPDITADLLKAQSHMKQNMPSTDLRPVDNRLLTWGQGDQRGVDPRKSEGLAAGIDNSRPRNNNRTNLSKVNQSAASFTEQDEEDEDSQLTIDMPE